MMRRVLVICKPGVREMGPRSAEQRCARHRARDTGAGAGRNPVAPDAACHEGVRRSAA